MYKAFCISFGTKQINTPQAGIYRDHPCLVIDGAIIGLFFLPRKMFISQAVLQRDTIHCSCPIHGNLHSPSSQALSAAHAGNKCQNPHPKHRVGIFKREILLWLESCFLFFDVNFQDFTTVQSRGCSCVSEWMAKPRQ